MKIGDACQYVVTGNAPVAALITHVYSGTMSDVVDLVTFQRDGTVGYPSSIWFREIGQDVPSSGNYAQYGPDPA